MFMTTAMQVEPQVVIDYVFGSLTVCLIVFVCFMVYKHNKRVR
jgi:hypothetical protein